VLKSNGEIYDANSDGTSPRKLTNTSLPKGYAQYSPDGTKIAFTQDFGGGNYQVMLMNADGSGLLRLNNDIKVHYYVSWTPDGKILYTLADNINSNHALFMMNANGTNPGPFVFKNGLTETNLRDPVMDSTKKFIFYTDNQFSIHMIFLDGGTDLNLGLLTGDFDYSPN
jgi:Tol biopolymer transport system component